MPLPNLHAAEVPEAKLSGYLLSFDHPAGRGKARFFTELGFRADAPQVLRLALLQHAATNEVSSVQRGPFGSKYLIDGRVYGPAGRSANIRSVWFTETGRSNARLITAYPLRGMHT